MESLISKLQGGTTGQSKLTGEFDPGVEAWLANDTPDLVCLGKRSGTAGLVCIGLASCHDSGVDAAFHRAFFTLRHLASPFLCLPVSSLMIRSISKTAEVSHQQSLWVSCISCC